MKIFGLVITTAKRHDRDQVDSWDLGRACGRLSLKIELGLLSDHDLERIERAAERER